MRKILRRAVALIALAAASFPTWAQEASAMADAAAGHVVTAAANDAAAAPARPFAVASASGHRPTPAASPCLSPGLTPAQALHPLAAAARLARTADHHDRAGLQRPTRDTSPPFAAPDVPAPAGDLRMRKVGGFDVAGVAKKRLYGDIKQMRFNAGVTTAV